jgi:hypothetical protein
MKLYNLKLYNLRDKASSQKSIGFGDGKRFRFSLLREKVAEISQKENNRDQSKSYVVIHLIESLEAMLWLYRYCVLYTVFY